PVRRPPPTPLVPYTTLFRSAHLYNRGGHHNLCFAFYKTLHFIIFIGGFHPAMHYGNLVFGLGEIPFYTCVTIHKVFVIHCFTFRSEEHTSELQSRENLVCRL